MHILICVCVCVCLFCVGLTCSLETELTQQRCIPTARAIINILNADLRRQEARGDRNSTLSNDTRACYYDGPARYCGTLRPLTTQSVRHHAVWIRAGTLWPWSPEVPALLITLFTLVRYKQTQNTMELYFRSQFVFQWRYFRSLGPSNHDAATSTVSTGLKANWILFVAVWKHEARNLTAYDKNKKYKYKGSLSFCMCGSFGETLNTAHS